MLFQRPLDGVDIVVNDGRNAGNTEGGQPGLHGDQVAGVKLTGMKRFTGRHDLIADADDRHTRPAVNPDRLMPAAAASPRRPGVILPPPDDRRPGCHLDAGLQNIPARTGIGFDEHVPPRPFLAELAGNDRIGPVRYRRPGTEPDGLSFPDPAAEGNAGE